MKCCTPLVRCGSTVVLVYLGTRIRGRGALVNLRCSLILCETLFVAQICDRLGFSDLFDSVGCGVAYLKVVVKVLIVPGKVA